MKKLYFAPETVIVEIKVESLMAPTSLQDEASEDMSGFSRESDWED